MRPVTVRPRAGNLKLPKPKHGLGVGHEANARILDDPPFSGVELLQEPPSKLKWVSLTRGDQL